jgi:hypothetical protein
MKVQKTWTTDDEKSFINMLGKPNISMDKFCVRDRMGTSRLALLVAYKIGLTDRTIWSGLCKQEIMEHIEQEIHDEEKNKGA